jgi:rhodanese-related sulfurtransferase
MANFDDNQNIYIHCLGGYRSVIASSLIKRQGIHNIRNVLGGFKAISELPDKFDIEQTVIAEEV